MSFKKLAYYVLAWESVVKSTIPKGKYQSLRNTLELKQDWSPILKLSTEFCTDKNKAFSKEKK